MGVGIARILLPLRLHGLTRCEQVFGKSVEGTRRRTRNTHEFDVFVVDGGEVTGPIAQQALHHAAASFSSFSTVPTGKPTAALFGSSLGRRVFVRSKVANATL